MLRKLPNFSKYNLIIFCVIVAVFGGLFLRYRTEFYKELEHIRNSGDSLYGVLNQLKASNRARKENKAYELIFVGDIMLSRSVGKMIEKRKNDARYPFALIAEELLKADMVFGNLEGPISNRGANQGSIYSFRAKPRVVEGLQFAGFDILSLANNHIWDWGRDALTDTREILESNGIKGIGAGKNEEKANEHHIFDLKGTKIAFLAYTNLYPRRLEARGENPGISTFETEKVHNVIQRLKSEGIHLVIISFHWGNEYQNHSDGNQQKIARDLIDAGADLIVGHHPHVVQEIERYKSGVIIYSLGNFIFDQDFSKETMEGLMVKATIQKKKIVHIEPITIRISDTFQPYSVTTPIDL